MGTGFQSGWLGLSGTVFRLSSGMIRGVGRRFLESGLVGFFQLSTQTRGRVGDLGVWDRSTWVWGPGWRKPLFA